MPMLLAPNLILLALNQPKKGHEVLAGIKECPTLKRIPVVMLAISKDRKDVLRAYSLHADYYVTEPINLDRFVEAVRTIG